MYSDSVGGPEALKQLESRRFGWSTSLKRGVNESGEAGILRAVFDHSFHFFVVVAVSVSALNHFHAQKYGRGVDIYGPCRKSTE